MLPTAPPPAAPGLRPAPGFDVTVLPDAVVEVVGADGAGVDGRGSVFRLPLVRRGVVRGSLFVDVGALVDGAFAGTSLSCGCVVVSRPASAKSRLSVVS